MYKAFGGLGTPSEGTSPPSWPHTVTKLSAPYTFLSRGSIWYTPVAYCHMETRILMEFSLRTLTGCHLVIHHSILKNHTSFQIYAKRSFDCRWSHVAATIHHKMIILQRQPCSRQKCDRFFVMTRVAPNF